MFVFCSIFSHILYYKHHISSIPVTCNDLCIDVHILFKTEDSEQPPNIYKQVVVSDVCKIHVLN